MYTFKMNELKRIHLLWFNFDDEQDDEMMGMVIRII